jgi:hypothetical protein
LLSQTRGFFGVRTKKKEKRKIERDIKKKKEREKD